MYRAVAIHHVAYVMADVNVATMLRAVNGFRATGIGRHEHITFCHMNVAVSIRQRRLDLPDPSGEAHPSEVKRLCLDREKWLYLGQLMVLYIMQVARHYWGK